MRRAQPSRCWRSTTRRRRPTASRCRFGLAAPERAIATAPGHPALRASAARAGARSRAHQLAEGRRSTAGSRAGWPASPCCGTSATGSPRLPPRRCGRPRSSCWRSSCPTRSSSTPTRRGTLRVRAPASVIPSPVIHDGAARPPSPTVRPERSRAARRDGRPARAVEGPGRLPPRLRRGVRRRATSGPSIVGSRCSARRTSRRSCTARPRPRHPRAGRVHGLRRRRLGVLAASTASCTRR